MTVVPALETDLESLHNLQRLDLSLAVCFFPQLFSILLHFHPSHVECSLNRISSDQIQTSFQSPTTLSLPILQIQGRISVSVIGCECFCTSCNSNFSNFYLCAIGDVLTRVTDVVPQIAPHTTLGQFKFLFFFFFFHDQQLSKAQSCLHWLWFSSSPASNVDPILSTPFSQIYFVSSSALVLQSSHHAQLSVFSTRHSSRKGRTSIAYSLRSRICYRWQSPKHLQRSFGSLYHVLARQRTFP